MKEFLFLVGFGIGLVCGYIAGCSDGHRAMQLEAVAKGHAEYYLDEKHVRQWRWKETENVK